MKAVVLALDPTGAEHGGAQRIRATAAALEAHGWEVEVVAPPGGHPAGPPGLARRVKRFLAPMPTASGARSAALGEALERARPDLLVVTRLPAAPFHRRVPSARLWLDLPDLYSRVALREARVAPAQRGGGLLQAGPLVLQEAHWARRATLTTFAGWGDARAARWVPGHDGAWLPNPVPAPERPPAPPAQLRVAGFLGNMDYWPNRAAVDLLRTRWAPALAALGVRVVIAGRGARHGLTAGMDDLGELADVRAFYEAVDCTLAPIERGGGIKVKVIESLLWRRPVLGTAFAFDGMRVVPAACRATTLPVAPDLAHLRAAPLDVAALHDDYTPATFTARVGELLDRAGLRARATAART